MIQEIENVYIWLLGLSYYTNSQDIRFESMSKNSHATFRVYGRRHSKLYRNFTGENTTPEHIKEALEIFCNQKANLSTTG